MIRHNHRQPKSRQTPPSSDTTAARAICERCLVRDECAAYGIEHDEVGVWGGLDQRERRAMKRTAA